MVHKLLAWVPGPSPRSQPSRPYGTTSCVTHASPFVLLGWRSPMVGWARWHRISQPTPAAGCAAGVKTTQYMT